MKKRGYSHLTIWFMIFILALFLPGIEAKATQSRTDNFNKSYTLTGNAQSDMVAIARAQINRTQSQFGYTEAWCADFVSDCAKLAGQSRAIPANGSCYSLMKAVKSAGGYVVDKSQAKAGDLVFFSSSNYPNGGAHVELVYNYTNGKLQSIGGNCYINGAWRVYDRSNGRSSSVSYYCVIRPNYSGGRSPILPGTLDNSYNVPVTLQPKASSGRVSTYDVYGSVESGRYIDQGDNCYITEVYTNGFVKVRYPISGGTRWSYAKASDFPLTKKGVSPTGYDISISSHEIYDCEPFTVTINPYQKDITNYTIYVVLSDGRTASYNLGSQNNEKFYFRGVDTLTIYAKVTNQYGSFCGSTSNGQVSIKIKRPSMGTPLDLGNQFNAYIIHDSSGNALTNDNVNVSNKTFTGASNQKWCFRKKSDGSYTIESISGNGKCLDAYGGKGYQGDNVQVYKENGEEVQSWYIYSAGNGLYHFMPSYSKSAVLDISGGSNTSGTNVQIWAYNQTAAQKFRIKNYYDTYLELSDSNVYLDLAKTNTATIGILPKGSLPDSYYLNVKKDDTAMSTKWNGWVNHTQSLTLVGKKTGHYTATVSLMNHKNNDVCCKREIKVIISCSHHFGSWVKERTATCISYGYMTRKCAACGYSELKTLEKLDHRYGAWSTTKAATCTSDGTQTRKCTVCGKTETKVVTKLGHSYTSEVIAPTCTGKGYTYHICSRCSRSVYMDEYTNALGHKYSAWTTTKAATCTADGTQTRKCTACGKTETKVITKLGHSYTSKVIAPTCVEKGYTLYTCSRCGTSYKDKYTNTTDHKYSAWTTTKAATCTADGTQTRKCTACGKTETKVITKLGHSYTSKVIASTCTEKGYTLHTCSKCGDTYKDQETTVTDHVYETVTDKASHGKNGSIVKKCIKCGKSVETDIIYAPKYITLSQTTYMYNGRIQRPEIAIKDVKNKIISSKDYSVVYSSGCKNVGKYYVRITFKGKYSGVIRKVFYINPKSTSLTKLSARSKGFAVYWHRQTSQVTGYQLQYSSNSRFKGAKTVTIRSSRAYAKSISRLSAKRRYYVRIRTYKTVSGKTYYSGWSKAKYITTKR